MAIAPVRPWLSKSELLQFARCSQGFLLRRARLVTDPASGAAAADRIAAGTEFDHRARRHGSGRRCPVWVAVVTRWLPGPIAGRVAPSASVIYNEQTYRNSALGFVGKPDGIVVAHGRMEPLEIKRRPQSTDVLELAFYWLLLAPERRGGHDLPRGWLQYEGSDGTPDAPHRVDIAPEVIGRVHALAAQARVALADEMSLHWCECGVCAQYRPVAVGQRHGAPLTKINGIGRKRAAALAAAGVTCVGQLLTATPDKLRGAIRTGWYDSGIDYSTLRFLDEPTDLGEEVDTEDFNDDCCDRPQCRTPSLGEAERWIAHAEVFVSDEPRLLETYRSIPEQYLAIDLEYQSATPTTVWSICAQTAGIRPSHRITIIAGSDQQGRQLQRLAGFLTLHPGLPIVTWGGKGTDIDKLNKVARSYPMPSGFNSNELLADLDRRHFDLCALLKDSVLLPISGNRLKDIGAYIGVDNPTPRMDGFLADKLWTSYQHNRDACMLNELVNYSRNDVALLVRVAEHLRALLKAPPVPLAVNTSFDTDEYIDLHEE